MKCALNVIRQAGTWSANVYFIECVSFKPSPEVHCVYVLFSRQMSAVAYVTCRKFSLMSELKEWKFTPTNLGAKTAFATNLHCVTRLVQILQSLGTRSWVFLGSNLVPHCGWVLMPHAGGLCFFVASVNSLLQCFRIADDVGCVLSVILKSVEAFRPRSAAWDTPRDKRFAIAHALATWFYVLLVNISWLNHGVRYVLGVILPAGA